MLPLLVAILLLTASTAYAQGDLQSRVVGNTFFLTSLCAGDDLRFTADGKPAKPCTPEPYTVGLLHVDKVEKSPSELKITAHRVGLIFRGDTPQQVDLSHPRNGGGKPHPVVLHLAAPPSGDFNLPLAAVLTTRYDDLLPNLPEAWREFFHAHLASSPASDHPASSVQQADSRPVTQAEIDQAQINPMANEPIPADSSPGAAASRALPDPSAGVVTNRPGKNGVTIPKVIRQQPAAFSPQARNMGYAAVSLIGLVVDEHGDVTRAWVRVPAGLALDEQALAAVARYKFQPATKDGQPVPVRLDVEVSFQIEME